MIFMETFSFNGYRSGASDRSKDFFIQVPHPYSLIISAL